PGDEATGPLEISGSARVFEANVSLRLETAAGQALVETFATASEGAPGRGDFEATLPFDVDEPTDAFLVAFEASADDGSEQRVVRVPVRLCPASGC
ncbi:MAG TPA: Gmad2 immunoglobulin-like domain-containing protein, partial [Gaiellaceae bacterium]|nr:Gmad2 immunoglobulin-like domain-containing protein [Gaiellaceae bacterium]